MGFYKGRPPINKQNKKNSCWAACVNSFSRAMVGVPTYSETSLIRDFGIGDQKGGINLVQLKALGVELARYGVKLDKEIPQSDMCPQWIEERLQKSYIVLMYQTAINSTDWHAILVYGIDDWLIFMDPRHGTYEKVPTYTMISELGFYAFYKP